MLRIPINIAPNLIESMKEFMEFRKKIVCKTRVTLRKNTIKVSFFVKSKEKDVWLRFYFETKYESEELAKKHYEKFVGQKEFAKDLLLMMLFLYGGFEQLWMPPKIEPVRPTTTTTI